MKFKSLYIYLLNWTNVDRSISIRSLSNPGRNNRGSCKRKPLSTGVPLRFGPVFAYGYPEGERHHRIRYISILEGLVLPSSPPVPLYKSRLSSLDSSFSLRNLKKREKKNWKGGKKKECMRQRYDARNCSNKNRSCSDWQDTWLILIRFISLSSAVES